MLEMVTPTLRQITPPRLRNLTIRLGWENGQPKKAVEPGDAMFLWLAQFLGSTAPITVDQIDLILDAFGKTIRQYGASFADEYRGGEQKLKIGHLMIADGKFASISGSDVFLNLTSGDVVTGLTRAPAMVSHYNMGEIYTRGLASMNRQEQPDGHPKLPNT
jgi:hypothetical protein